MDAAKPPRAPAAGALHRLRPPTPSATSTSCDGSRYSARHGRFHPVFREFLEEFGYYDIFLVEPDTGHIVYSVFKEVDYATSLLDGPWAESGIGRAFRCAIVVEDYRGVPVLSAAAPIDVLGERYAILAEIDAAEAFASTLALRDLIVGGLACVLFLVIAVGALVATRITRPVLAVVDVIRRVAA